MGRGLFIKMCDKDSFSVHFETEEACRLGKSERKLQRSKREMDPEQQSEEGLGGSVFQLPTSTVFQEMSIAPSGGCRLIVRPVDALLGLKTTAIWHFSAVFLLFSAFPCCLLQ